MRTSETHPSSQRDDSWVDTDNKLSVSFLGTFRILRFMVSVCDTQTEDRINKKGPDFHQNLQYIYYGYSLSHNSIFYFQYLRSFISGYFTKFGILGKRFSVSRDHLFNFGLPFVGR